ncbi:hypothetical protein COL70_28190 [Bacillus pseudomycoides]|uniref:Uncharacterized protein n=1 Tax=Bacillus pseudomycoides TaxID=64104 RepID=A0AAJ1Z8R8_9BACI|nr:hypothetical protein [Bacillus pseudomycoides]PFZ83544.1 hypothetical protein COL70_28190 [Bacillus pseudomycoides]
MRNLKKLGDSLIEGRTENMAEERNWNQICTKAEKLRAADEKSGLGGKSLNSLVLRKGICTTTFLEDEKQKTYLESV